MTTRADATPLSLGDRFYLIQEAINMIEEGINDLHDEAVEEGIDPDDHELWDSLDELRTTSYASLLATMVNDADEAKEMITLMKQKADELNDE